MNIYNNICTSSIKILYSFEHGSYSTDGFVHHFSGLDMHQETKKGFIETFITRQSNDGTRGSLEQYFSNLGFGFSENSSLHGSLKLLLDLLILLNFQQKSIIRAMTVILEIP